MGCDPLLTSSLEIGAVPLKSLRTRIPVSFPHLTSVSMGLERTAEHLLELIKKRRQL